MGQPGAPVRQHQAVGAHGVQRANQGAQVAGDLDRVGYQHQRRGSEVDGVRVVRREPGDRDHAVGLPALGDPLQRPGRDPVRLLGPAGDLLAAGACLVGVRQLGHHRRCDRHAPGQYQSVRPQALRDDRRSRLTGVALDSTLLARGGQADRCSHGSASA